MGNDIYDHHRAAFSHVAAYVFTRNGKTYGTVAFKFPRDGAGRLWAYLHWHGLPMTRAFAGGYGYDKRTAALASAAAKMPPALPEGYDDDAQLYTAVKAALSQDDGHEWQYHLRSFGFDVLQAV